MQQLNPTKMRALLLTLFLTIALLSIQAQSLNVVATGDTAVCIGDSIPLEVFVSGGAPPYTYQWNLGDWFECDTCASTLAYTQGDTTYTIVVTDSLGAIEIDYVRVTHRNPDTVSGHGLLSVEVFGNGPYIADSLEFSVDSTLAQLGVWSIALRGTSSYSISDSVGTFAFYNLFEFCLAVKEDWQCPLEVTMCYAPEGSCEIYCSDTTLIIGYLGGSIAEKNTIQVDLYPNPVNETLAISGEVFGLTDVLIYNAFGQLVLQHHATDLLDEQIDVSTFAPGIYILHIQTKDGLAVHRVVKN